MPPLDPYAAGMTTPSEVARFNKLSRSRQLLSTWLHQTCKKPGAEALGEAEGAMWRNDAQGFAIESTLCQDGIKMTKIFRGEVDMGWSHYAWIADIGGRKVEVCGKNLEDALKIARRIFTDVEREVLAEAEELKTRAHVWPQSVTDEDRDSMRRLLQPLKLFSASPQMTVAGRKKAQELLSILKRYLALISGTVVA